VERTTAYPTRHKYRQASIPIINIQHHNVFFTGNVCTTTNEEEITDTLHLTREPGSSNRFTPFATSTVAADRHYDVGLFLSQTFSDGSAKWHRASLAYLPGNRLQFGAHWILDTQKLCLYNNRLSACGH
jgi:hypothetical protein